MSFLKVLLANPNVERYKTLKTVCIFYAKLG